jgi:prepilin-type N-terminal cleavage/methylation domain-containing protein
MVNDDTRGFSLLELLVALGVLSVVVFAIADLNLSLRKQQITTTYSTQLDVLKRNIVAVVNNENSWLKTIAAGSPTGLYPQSNMGCLADGTTPCTVDGTPGGALIQNQPLALLDAAGNVVFDSTQPNSGFTLQGLPCSNFSMTGNDDCPLRFQLNWSAVCSPPCTNPLVKVNGTLLSKQSSGKGLIINLNNYSVPDIMRNGQ